MKKEQEQWFKEGQIQKDIEKVISELKAKGFSIAEAVILAHTPAYRENYIKRLLK